MKSGDERGGFRRPASTVTSAVVGGVSKGKRGRSQESGRLVEAQAVVDVCWSLVVQGF